MIFITWGGVSEGQLSLSIFFVPNALKIISRHYSFFKYRGSGGSPGARGPFFQKCSKNGLVAKKMIITFFLGGGGSRPKVINITFFLNPSLTEKISLFFPTSRSRPKS